MRPVGKDPRASCGQASQVPKIFSVISTVPKVGKRIKPWPKVLVDLSGHRSLFTGLVAVHASTSHFG